MALVHIVMPPVEVSPVRRIPVMVRSGEPGLLRRTITWGGNLACNYTEKLFLCYKSSIERLAIILVCEIRADAWHQGEDKTGNLQAHMMGKCGTKKPVRNKPASL